MQISGTYPNLSANGAGTAKYIPTLFSQKATVKHYDMTVCGEITSNDWEGEVTKLGDKVVIRRTPDVSVGDYQKNLDIAYETPEDNATELELNRGKYYAVVLDDVDRIQSDMGLMDMYAEDAAEQVVLKQDAEFLSSIVADISPQNQGASAGRKSGAIDLGAVGAPVVIDADNAVKFLMRMNQSLTEQGVSRVGRWVVLPAWFCTILKNTDVKSALITGDAEGAIRNGRLGTIDGLTIYESNQLTDYIDTTLNVTPVIAGHKDGVTWANQFINAEVIRLQTKFASAIRGLAVYGYKVVEPRYLSLGRVTPDLSAL
ncbi:hypothetical protein D0B54_17990 [Solimonas sp. K1W22B-7]|nr:hypothetical protein D0B54_17990 [Solimonas sp. K1W22B-7]